MANKYLKVLNQFLFLLCSIPAFGQTPNSIEAYSLGQYEIGLREWPSAITVRLPLNWIENQMRLSLEQAGSQSTDIPFTVKQASFLGFVPGSPTLKYLVHIDGNIRALANESFGCRIAFDFAVPRAPPFNLQSQLLAMDHSCSVSGEFAKFFILDGFLEQVLRIAIWSALNRVILSPKDEKGPYVDMMKSDPELVAFLQTGAVQLRYCEGLRWKQALCLDVAWPSLAITNLFLRARSAPTAKGPIQGAPLSLRVEQFSAAGPFKPSTREPPYLFPSKRYAVDDYDDGDAVIFNGLMCLSGESEGCEAVRRSQDKDGRFWRSPDRIDSPDVNPFSGDQLNGVIAYIIKTQDRGALERFLNYVSTQRQPIPDATFAVDYGYKSCTNDVSNTCLIGGGGWLLLAHLAKEFGFIHLVPSEMRDVQARFGYGPAIFKWEAAFSPVGYRLHLVALQVFFAQVLGLADERHADAAAMLAFREPNNPFFLYLHLGKDARVFEELESKCKVDAAQTVFSQWAWEREEADLAWKKSMMWDCAFMYRLLQ